MKKERLQFCRVASKRTDIKIRHEHGRKKQAIGTDLLSSLNEANTVNKVIK